MRYFVYAITTESFPDELLTAISEVDAMKEIFEYDENIKTVEEAMNFFCTDSTNGTTGEWVEVGEIIGKITQGKIQ